MTTILRPWQQHEAIPDSAFVSLAHKKIYEGWVNNEYDFTRKRLTACELLSMPAIVAYKDDSIGIITQDTILSDTEAADYIAYFKGFASHLDYDKNVLFLVQPRNLNKRG